MIGDFITPMSLPNKVIKSFLKEANNMVFKKIINKEKRCAYNHGNLAFHILARKLKRRILKLAGSGLKLTEMK